jgi:hypothetical protein
MYYPSKPQNEKPTALFPLKRCNDATARIERAVSIIYQKYPKPDINQVIRDAELLHEISEQGVKIDKILKIVFE